MRIEDRYFSGAMALFCASAQMYASGQSFPSDGVKQPNVIFILADDMGYGDMGCTGHPYLKTPNLDRLATEGTLFKQFYSSSPVCSPSRASFMTGRYPAELGIHGHISSHENNKARGINDFLDPALPNLASEFKRAGYAVAHFGKWHLLTPDYRDKGPFPDEYGFDFYSIYSTGKLAGTVEHSWADPYYRSYSTRWFVDDALSFIKQCMSDKKPFFVNLWTLVPHEPLKPIAEELAEYTDLVADPDDFSTYMRDYVKLAPNPTEQMKTYCAAVTGMDKALGFFFDQLKVMGLEEDTIIVFTSDNGPEDYQISNAGNAAMGSPGEKRGRKRSVYGGGVHVPCIVRWPGKVPAGRIDSETIWAGVDVLPTLLKLANISDSIKTSGEDVSPALLGNPFKRAKPLFWEWRFDVKRAPYTPPSLAVQDGEWRGYVNADGSRAELYNTAVDSQESKNLADENPERSAQLVAEMLNWKGRLSQ